MSRRKVENSTTSQPSISAIEERKIYLSEFLSRLKRRPEVAGAFSRHCQSRGIRFATPSEFNDLFNSFTRRSIGAK